MKLLMRTMVVTLALLGTGSALADDTTTGTAPEPTVMQKVEGAVVRAADATERGIRKGAHAAASGIECGLKAAGHGIETGAKAVGRVAQRVGDKIQGVVGSEPIEKRDG